MKYPSRWFLASALSAVLAFAVAWNWEVERLSPEAQAGFAVVEAKLAKLEASGPKSFDAPDHAADFFLKQRLAPGMEELPLDHLWAESENLRGRENDLLKAGVAPPGGIASWNELGPGNIGGRTRAIVFDPNDSNVMYAGGVAGGVWKSTDAGASWSPTDDLMLNMAVSTIAIHPTDSNILYAGTGEGFGASVYVQGNGIFKSTDAGATWNRLAATATGNFNYVNKIRISPNNPNRIYAATRTGVWRSVNGGVSWTAVLKNPDYLGGLPASNGSFLGCTDIALRQDTDPDTIFAAFGSFQADGFFRSQDGGTTWTEYIVPSNQGRTTIAIAPSNNDIMYLLMADNGSGGATGKLVDVYRSDDGGDSFTGQVNFDSLTGEWLLSNLILATGCISTSSVYSQGWHDNIIAVDPVDPDIVWVGGVDMFRSDDGGQNFGIAAYWIYYTLDPLPPYQLHPDHHELVFHPDYDGVTNQTLYATNDGGIYRTDNARAATSQEDCPLYGSGAFPQIVWQSLNSSYGVTQFYHGDSAKGVDTFVGGAQDNGTNRAQSATAPNDWDLIFGGDGGYVAIDPTDDQTMYIEYQFFPTFHKSTDGGDTFVEVTNGITDDDGLFITPFAMDQNDPQTIWSGGTRPWRTTNGAASWSPAGPFFGAPGTISAIAVAPSDSDVVYMGFDNGYVARTTNGTTLSPSWSVLSSGLPFGYISSVAVDPGDPDTAYATYSTFGLQHVYRTVNGGLSWTPIDGISFSGIPDIPVHWLEVRPCNPSQLYAGTELGVFASDDGGTTWQPANTGLAHTVVESLDFQDADTLVAFTHGRGAFRAQLDPCPSVTVYGCGVNPAGSMAFGGGLPSIGQTVQLELHDPTGTMGPVSLTYLFVASAPDPSFPCGTSVPGWGMSSPSAPGELLLSTLPPNPLAIITGPAWFGSPATVDIPIPANPALVGFPVYAQGALVTLLGKIGLTDAVELVIGS